MIYRSYSKWNIKVNVSIQWEHKYEGIVSFSEIGVSENKLDESESLKNIDSDVAGLYKFEGTAKISNGSVSLNMILYTFYRSQELLD